MRLWTLKMRLWTLRSVEWILKIILRLKTEVPENEDLVPAKEPSGP